MNASARSYQTTGADLASALTGLTRGKRVMDLPFNLKSRMDLVAGNASLRELPIDEALARVRKQIERQVRFAEKRDWKFCANTLVALRQIERELEAG